MEWNELKELLKECGLKAGQIYEIKNYLAIEKGRYFNIEVKTQQMQTGTSYTVSE